jgi:multiple antibiotic resistance protein
MIAILSAAFLLFLVMDPLGNVAVFLPALRAVHPARQKKVLVRELLIALAAMLVFLFIGRYALALLHISEPALAAGGGVVLLLIALRMIFPSHDRSLTEEIEGEPFIVPLAIPYVAGPSALATVLLLVTREPGRWPAWLLAIFIAWLITSVILFFASGLARFLGARGLLALERLMGMVLVTIAVEMLLRGVRQFLSLPFDG